jgi:hypothetical protein
VASAETARVGVGEDEDAVVAIDDPCAPARVARQPRVPHRIQVAGDDAIAGPELRRHVVVEPGGAPVPQGR